MSNQSPKKIVKIMVFGTFDGLHLGHLNFFKQARDLAGKNHQSFLLVSVARDKNVTRIKGKRSIFNEKKRKILIEESKMVDKVVFAGLKNYLPHICKEKPDIIGLGYDQFSYVENLKKDLLSCGLKTKIVRLKPYKENIYKNTLLKQKLLDITKTKGDEVA